MADPNPLDSFLHSETDESVVNALVASLESRLASPTHKEQSPSISNPSVNSNHVSNASTIPACTSAQNNSVHLSNDTGNPSHSSSKAVIKDSQILGINSIHTSSSTARVNSPVNSHGTASPKPLNNVTSVNKSVSPVVQVLSQPQNHGNHSVVVNAHLNRATPPPNAVNSLNATSVNQIIITNQTGVTQNSVKNVTRNVSPAPQLITTGQPGVVQQTQSIVRNNQGVVLNSNSQPLTQKANVHIIHSANVTSMITQPGSNPSVIAVRGQVPTSHITAVRPQVVTSQVTNSSSPRPQGSFKIQANRMPNAPIRIASSQSTQSSQQINIAPRPGGHPSTITLPHGIVPGQGAVLMKNEQGHIMLVQQGPLQGQHTASSVTISTSSTSQKVQYVRHPTAGATHRLPSGQIILQPGAQTQPQTIVRQAVPAPVNTARPQQGVRVTMSQSVVRTSTPSGQQTSAGQPSVAAQAAQQQQMIENMKKCKNFLSTLIKLAASQPEATVSSVRDLIQGLIDGKLEPEVFTEKLQKELKSSPQPYLVPFLKKSLPLLRQSLLNNKMSIDGVKPPPPEIVQNLPVSITQVVQPTTHNQASKVSTPFHPKPSLAQVGSNKPPLTKQMNMIGGNVPSTVKAFQSRVAGLTPSSSPGPTHSHKDNKRLKESFKDDDDINDVATMGGVNLTEESRNILATNAEFVGTQIRSCKDEAFLSQGPLLSRIHAIARKHGITEVPTDVANIISHATQERLRHIVEKLSTIAEQRTEIYRLNDKFNPSLDVKAQTKFLEELDVLERKRHDEQEKEMLRRAAKSRSKHEDPEHLKLKQRAKDMQAAEMEEVRQREANLTALAAIGPRKKRKLDEAMGSSSSLTNGPSSSTSRTALRPRIKRVNLRDLLFLMEQDKTLNKSDTLYRTFLK
ncbi:hypothetical protein ACF0H5_005991 [Mactra antiquata]